MKTMMLVLILVMCQATWASSWVLSIKPEFVDTKDKVKKSVLRFHHRAGGTKTYAPPQYPWGLYDTKEVAVGGKNYFITYWSGGARSVYYRIFNPDKSETPICEFSTESEEPSLRFYKGSLQYLETVFHEDKKKITIWKKCVPVVTEPNHTKGPASVKRTPVIKFDKIKKIK